MATRYHRLPHQLLRLSLDEWAINLAVMQAGVQQDKRDAESH